MMKLPKDQPFWTSVILHFVVLVGLFLATIVEAIRPKEKPHVFEIVAVSQAPQGPRSSSPDQPIEQPTLEPLRFQDVPDLVERVEQPPQNEPPRERPKLISKETFDREHGKPKPQTTVRQTPPRNEFVPPVIDAPGPIDPGPTPNFQRGPTADQISALGAYNAQLRAKIERAWKKPSNLSGMEVSATVIFDVSPSGRITNVRLRPGSGNAIFDQSIVTALKGIVSAGPTPTRRLESFQMTFKMIY